MRIAIVEDHPAERELIATMCAEYFNGRNVGATAGRNAMQTVCDVFPDAKSFIESWKNSRYDLLLLDCYLSDENLPHATTGLDIARLLRNQNDDCAIVFITSSTDFAVLGYEVQASGYLLKPVNRKTFEATMERVEEQLKAKPPVTHLAKAQSPGTVDSSWHVAFGNPAVTMDRRLIAYALSNAHYVEFTFADGTQTKIRTNFSDVDQRLTVFDNFYRTARGVLCGTLGIPSLWTVIPTAPLVLLVLRWLTELPWRQLLLIVATASYMVAIVYYLSLVIDVAVLGADSTNLRVGWPGLVNLLLLDVVVLVSLWHPLHDSIPATFDSPSISKGFWQLIWLFPFVSSAIVVWCMPADNSTLLDSHMLEIAFTVAVVYSCFMVLVYFLIWYMIQQSDRLLAARRRQHYEALQTLQLQHMNERIREARQIKHNVRHHIHSLQALAAAEDMDGIRSYLDEMSKHRLLQTAPMQYCEHASLNAVLVYYCDWVRHLGADVDVKAAVPQYININNAELCSMVGNLLENATEAITQQTQGERRLKVRIRYRSGPPAALFITVDNTYGEADTSIEQIDGDLVSTKHGGTGLGTATVRETAERHHGTASFEHSDGMFRASVMLCLGD